ncbi:hypothetical protein AKJ16_DCAP18782, partial [Drosera capensis]
IIFDLHLPESEIVPIEFVDLHFAVFCHCSHSSEKTLSLLRNRCGKATASCEAEVRRNSVVAGKVREQDLVAGKMTISSNSSISISSSTLL